jgi:hypothetical protein
MRSVSRKSRQFHRRKRCWVSTNYHLEDIPRCNDLCRWDEPGPARSASAAGRGQGCAADVTGRTVTSRPGSDGASQALV